MRDAAGSCGLGIVLALSLICASCAHTKGVLFESMSPDGAEELRLVGFSRFPIESGSFVQAELVSGQHTKVLQEWYRNDLGFSFAAVAWNTESGSLGLVWTDMYHGTEVAAYDVRRGIPINPSGLIPELADQIRLRYQLSKDVADPVAWTKTVEAQNAFARSRR